MRKTLELLSIVGIVFSLIFITVLYRQTIPIPISKSQSSAEEPFKALPLNEDRKIEFEIAEESLHRLTDREQRDQALDWLLLVTIKSAGLTAENLSQVLFDVSPIRHGYAKPTSNFEYGTTRSRFIGEGKIVALIPSGVSANKRLDLLGHIVDQHRKDQGSRPVKLFVFEYSLQPNLTGATLRRSADVSAATFFDEKSGYQEVTVKNLDDFARFMDRTEDLTYVSRANGNLVLGGRRQHETPLRKIRVEDVAALWQAEIKIQNELQAFDQKWKAEFDAFDSRWYGRKARPGLEHEQLQRQYDSEGKQLENQMIEDRKDKKLASGTGFSLDPIYDYQKLQKFFLKIQPALVLQSKSDSQMLPPAMVDEALQGIQKKDVGPFFQMAKHLEESGNSQAASFLVGMSGELQLQAARYDGELQGTEAGMVLFYTDLLAKLWAIDYVQSSPDKYIKDFHALTRTVVSPVFYEEMKKYDNARLWFGTRDEGFQVAGEGREMIFARNSTRVYAASSSTFEPGKEVEPSAKFEAFLGWWNDHYEEIADYEPEYQRLNEIMKWSLVITWLAENQANQPLDFLSNIKVDHNSWFPEWVKENPQLRFSNWDKVKFYGKGNLGKSTETMPILFSELYIRFPGTAFESEGTIRGGVSLAQKELFKGRSPLTSTTNQLIRRSSINYSDKASFGGEYRSFDGTKYVISHLKPDRSVVTVTPRDKVRLRDGFGQIARKDIERQLVSNKDKSLVIKTFSSEGAHKVDLGSLEIKETGQGFRVAWRSREIDEAQSLVRKASQAKSLKEIDNTLLSDPSVEEFLTLPGGGYSIKLRNTKDWLTIMPEREPGVELAQGWDTRISDPLKGIQSMQMVWEEPAQLMSRLESSKYVDIQPIPKNNGIVLHYSEARAPPNSHDIVIQTPFGDLRGSYNAEYQIIVAKLDELPQSLRNPSNLNKAITSQDFAEISKRASKETDVIHLVGNGGRGGGGSNGAGKYSFEDFDSGNPNQMAHWLAIDPRSARKALVAHFKEELHRTDLLFDHGDPVRALQELQLLEKRYGPVPDILAREAVAELKLNHLESTVKVTERIMGRRPLNREAFLDEVAMRLQFAQSGVNWQNAERLKQGIKWGTDPRVKSSGDVIMPFVKDDKVELGIKLGAVDDFATVSPNDVGKIPEDATIYVQDSPGLNHLDSASSIQNTLRDLTASNIKVHIKTLPRGDIKHYKPAVIYSPDVSQFQPHVNSKMELLKHGSHSFQKNGQSDDQCDNNDDKKRDDCRVYLVFEEKTGV